MRLSKSSIVSYLYYLFFTIWYMCTFYFPFGRIEIVGGYQCSSLNLSGIPLYVINTKPVGVPVAAIFFADNLLLEDK